MGIETGLSRQQVAKALRLFILASVVWTVHDGSIFPTLPIMAGYALRIGMTESQIAFLGGLLGLTGLWALAGARLTARARNKRRVCVLVGILGIPATPALIAVGLWVAPQYRFAAVCALMAWLYLLGWTVVPILGSWQANVIPAEVRGPFLGRRLFIPALVSMGYLFGAGRWLDRFVPPDLSGFFTLFVIAFIAGVVGYLILGRAPYPPTEGGAEAAERGSWFAPLREPRFRRLAVFYAVAGIPPQMAGAFFSVYMINRLHLTYAQIAIYINVAYAFMLVGYLVGGSFSQRFGSRPVIQICSALYLAAPIAWAFATPGTYHVLIPIAYMLGGLCMAGLLVAESAFLLNIVPEGRDSTHYFGLWTALGAAGSSLGPFLGAALKNLLPETPVEVLGVAIGPIQVVFIVAAVLWIVPVILSWRLIEEGAQRPGYVMSQFRGNVLGFAWNTALYSVAGREDSRAEAIHRLGQTRSPFAIGRLMKALYDVSPEVRSEAARGLGEAKAEEAVPELVSRLQDEESDIRAEAAHALGKIGTGAGLEALVAALYDELPHVRSSAALALGELNTDVAQEALKAAAQGEFDRATFPAVIDGASRGGDLELIALALERLPLLRSPVLRMQVINAICRLLREKNHFYRLFSADPYQRVQMMTALARRVRRLFERSKVLPEETRHRVVEAAWGIQAAIQADDWPSLGEEALAIAGVIAALQNAHPVAQAAARAVTIYLEQISPDELTDEGAIFCIISLVSMARMLGGDTRG